MTPRSTQTSENAAFDTAHSANSLLVDRAARKSNIAAYEAYVLVVKPVITSPTHPAWDHPR